MSAVSAEDPVVVRPVSASLPPPCERTLIWSIARTRLTEQLLGPLADALDPELVTPLVVFLASEECTLTHELLSAGGGRYARAFVGLTPGWFAGKGAQPTAEEVRDQIGVIRDEQGYTIPLSAQDELRILLANLKGEKE